MAGWNFWVQRPCLTTISFFFGGGVCFHPLLDWLPKIIWLTTVKQNTGWDIPWAWSRRFVLTDITNCLRITVHKSFFIKLRELSIPSSHLNCKNYPVSNHRGLFSLALGSFQSDVIQTLISHRTENQFYEKQNRMLNQQGWNSHALRCEGQSTKPLTDVPTCYGAHSKGERKKSQVWQTKATWGV